MCGILTFLNQKRNVDTRKVLDLYLHQRDRGYDGFGFSYLNEANKIRTKRFVHEAEAFYALSRTKSRLIMFHHRHPTSTGNTEFQNHPISCTTEKGSYTLIHNGIIMNADELEKGHKVQYATLDTKYKFNDSEALLHELIAYLETGVDIKAEGSIAFVLLQGKVDGTLEKVHFGRNYSNPLHCMVGEKSKNVILSSELPKSMEQDEIMAHKLFTIDVEKKNEITEQYFRFPIRATTVTTYGDEREWSEWNKRKAEDIEITDERMARTVRQENYGEALKEADALIELFREEFKMGSIIEPEQCQLELQSIDDSIKSVREASFDAYNILTRKALQTITNLRIIRQRLLPDMPMAKTNLADIFKHGQTHLPIIHSLNNHHLSSEEQTMIQDIQAYD